MVWYFAYGSNGDEDRLHGERQVNFVEKKDAKLQGWQLIFNKISATNPNMAVANIRPNEHYSVDGIAYKLKDEELDKIDIYERAPEHYKRTKVTIEIDGTSVDAVTYVATKNHTFKDKELHPVGYGYINHVNRGAVHINYNRQLRSLKNYVDDL